MKGFVCNYAPLRFLPYRETGEFVNVGVAIHCPQADHFAFRVEMERTQRVTAFFPNLEVDILKKALEGMVRELEALPMARTDQEMIVGRNPEVTKRLMARFAELVRPREGLLHFGPTGTCLVDDPQAAAEEVFGRYVERHMARELV